MTQEEDQALVSLGERLYEEASSPLAAPNMQFRVRLLEHIDALEAQSEGVKEQKRLEKQGRKLDDTSDDQFYRDLYTATAQDAVWGKQEPVYNVHRAGRPPPPASQAVLSYE